MRKNIIIFTTVITLFCMNITAYASDNPRYMITKDYVIFEYVKYELIDNIITYNGMKYELRNNTLVSYDEEGYVNVIIIPTKEDLITDEKTINYLNGQVNNQLSDNRAVPSFVYDLPYSEKVPSGNYYFQTPAFNINRPGNKNNRFTILSIANISSGSTKKFTIGFLYCDALGKWNESEIVQDYDFGKLPLKIENASISQYGIFIIGATSGTPGFTYTVRLSKI